MRFMKWLVGLLAVVAVLLALVPLGARLYAVHWLEERGYKATIDTFSFNVFQSRITLAGVDIRAKDGRGFAVELMEASVSFSQLPQKALVIRKLRSQGLKIDVATLDTPISDLSAPVQRFINQHAPEWRFELINSLSENVEFCRSGVSEASKSLSQCLTVDSASVQDLSLQNTTRGWQLATRSSAHLQRIYFKDTINRASLVYVGDLKVRDFLGDDSGRRIGQITASEFHLVETAIDNSTKDSAPYQTQLDSLLINDIVETHSRDQSKIQISLVDITALRQTLYKDRDAALVLVRKLRDAFPTLDAAIDAGHLVKLEAGGVQKDIVVEILKTRIVDGGVAWVDQSVSPPARASFSGMSFELGAISSARPDDRSPLTFVAKLGGDGDVFMQGDWAPLSRTPSYNFDGHIRGLDLAKISAYTETMFAEKVTKGRLDAKFKINVVNGRIEGDSAVRFTQLQTLGGVNRDGVMSLQNAFNQLQNKNESVDFDMYFSFVLPSSSVLAEALGREAKRTLSAVANGRPSRKPMASAPVPKIMKFDDLKYGPNQQTLSGMQELRLRDIVAVAKENPNKRLVLCSVTTAGEWAAIYRQGKTLKSWEQIPSVERSHLLDIAKVRSKTLANQLVESGLNRGQLQFCEPTIALDDNGPSYLSSALE